MKTAILVTINDGERVVEYFDKAGEAITEYKARKSAIVQSGDSTGLELWESSGGITRRVKPKPRTLAELQNLEAEDASTKPDENPNVPSKRTRNKS